MDLRREHLLNRGRALVQSAGAFDVKLCPLSTSPLYATGAAWNCLNGNKNECATEYQKACGALHTLSWKNSKPFGISFVNKFVNDFTEEGWLNFSRQEEDRKQTSAANEFLVHSTRCKSRLRKVRT